MLNTHLKTIQNEMIDVIGTHIRNSILSEVRKAKYYSVIADEVNDIANKEQLSISVRYCLDCCVKGFCPSRKNHWQEYCRSNIAKVIFLGALPF